MRQNPLRVLASLLSVLLPLCVYLPTLAREITFTDSGELAAAAATLGIAHPPGYPLFILLGRLFSLLPAGTVAFRIALLGAAATALASFLIYRTGLTMLAALHAARPGRSELAADGRLPAALELAPLAGALLFAWARTPWSQAVVVEVYALQGALVVACLAACAASLVAGPAGLRHWPLVGFTLGLALTNHLTSFLLVPGVLTLCILGLVDRRAGSSGRRRESRRPPVPVGSTLIATLLPLVLYLYLPLRSRMNPAINWGYPESWQRFFVHVTARQYHGRLGSEGLRFAELERFLTEQLPGEAGWFFIALAVVGLVALWWRAWRFALITSIVAGAMMLYNLAYPIHDIRLYYLPVLAIAALWAAIGAGVVSGAVSRRAGRGGPAAGVAVAVLCCLFSLVPLTTHWRDNDQRDFELIAHYVRDTLTHLDEGALILSGRWDSFSSPALYYQIVEGVRPDVLVLDLGLLASPTLERHLAARAPALAEPCRAEMTAVAEIARRAERGERYNVSDARFTYGKLHRRLVETSMTQRSTYVTSDLFRRPMLRGINLISEGLAARLAWQDRYRDLPPPLFVGPGITPAMARDDTERMIVAEYGVMLRNRASYLELHGREREAAHLRERAAGLRR